MTDLRAKYGMKQTEKADFLHTSGYAKAQSGEGIGAAAASDASFATRRAIEDQRKYVQGYKNSRLLQGLHAYSHAKTYVPPIEKPANTFRGRGALAPADQPAQRSSDLSSTPSTTSAMNGYAARANTFGGRPNTPSFSPTPRPNPISRPSK